MNLSLSHIKNDFIQSRLSGLRLVLLGLVFATLFAGLIYFGLVLEYGLISLGIAAGLPLVYIFFKNPKIWIYFSTAFSFVYLYLTGEGISAEDVMAAVLFNGGVAIWLVHRVLIMRERIIDSFADWLLLFFFFGLMCNAAVAFFNGVDMLSWLREFIMMAVLLMYFPIKYHLRTKNDIRILLFILALVSIAIAATMYYSYYTDTITQAIYAFQLKSARRSNLAFYTAGALVGILYAVTEKRRIPQLFFAFTGMISTGALIISFARTYWAALAGGLVLMIIFLPNKNRIFIIAATLITSVLLFALMNLFFQDKARIFYKIIESRLTSSTKGLEDMSLKDRISESASVLKRIEKSPLSGNGMGAEYTFFSPILMMSVTKSFIHNGYLYMFFRLGIPLALVFLLWIFFFFFRSLRNIYHFKDTFSNRVNISVFLIFYILILSDFLTAQFTMRDGILLMTYSSSLLAVSERIGRNKQ